MRSKFGLVFAVCALAAFAATTVWGQQVASISGTVSDPTGAVVPGAHVTLTNTATGTHRTAITSGAGFYAIPSVGAGTYELTVRATGFKVSTEHGIEVAVDAQMRVDVHLQLGSATQTVTVAAAATHLQTNDASVSSVISGKQIQSIAVNGRNFSQLALLVPGASSVPNKGYSGISHLSTSGIAFNGMRATSNAYMIDGSDDLTVGSKTSLNTSPAMDAISQFRVSTSNYSAELGGAGGAVISIRLKSGTNHFHGSAYEFVRNDAFDARQALPYSPKKVPLKLNDFGFTIGGPVVRNHLFFFYSSEWRRLRQGETFVGHTPSQLELSGNFSQSPLTGTSALKNPTGDPNCVSGNQINPSCFNSNALALLKSGIFPSENAPGFNNYTAAPSLPSNFDQELTRVDYHINNKWQLMGHFIHESAIQTPITSTWGGSDFPTVTNTFSTPSINIVLRLTHIISPSLLNVVHFAVTEASDNGVPAGKYARPAGYTTPTIFKNNPYNRIPQLSFGLGYTGIDENIWPYALHNPVYTVNDTLTKTFSTQTLAIGGMYQRGTNAQANQCRTQGTFNFNGEFTGNPLADFLLGYPDSYSECSAEVIGQYRYNQFAAFAQDNIQVTNRLTINAGVRYYLIPHAYFDNGVTFWLPSLWKAADAPTLDGNGNVSCTPTYSLYPQSSTCNMYNGVLFAGTPNLEGVGKSMAHTSYLDFGPRIGIAWRLPWLGKTVLRTGYGIAYYRNQGNDSFNIVSNPPIVQNITYTNSPSNPVKLLDNPAGGTVAPATPFSLFVWEPDYRVPQYQQYSFGLQHMFGEHSVLSLAYVGSHGTHLRRQLDYNEPRATTINGVDYDFNPALNANAPTNLYRPYIGLGGITRSMTDANSDYNSMQVSFERQLVNNLRFQVSYTYGRGFDNATVSNRCNFNRQGCWAQGTTPAQILVFNYIYNVPFFRAQRGVAGKILGGWSWNGITSIANGAPFTAGITGAGIGLNPYPNVTGHVTYPKTTSEWFNTQAFEAPSLGQYGDEHLNTLYGPHYMDWDMTFSKNFLAPEGIQARLQVAFFNVFNNVNLDNPHSTFGASNFGEITGSGSPRIMQLGLHVSFRPA